ncbi:MAG: PBP1A family penicillin-binding protein [Candidatus Adiutrix sp.]|jgi:penicillin-binding protein 1A|nr:PBP1A family penicillin-binding protein [Candidatus Adiutrix sp.]
MEDKKRRRPANPLPDFDLEGPAAWGESPPEMKRAPARIRARAGAEKRAGRPAPRPPKTRRPLGFWFRFLIWVFWTGLSFSVAGGVAVFFAYHYLALDLPSTDGLKNYAPPTVTYFYSDDGRVVGEYYHERRFVVPLSDIPPLVQGAFLAVEDADFYAHHGINPKALLRAAIANFKSDGIAQGGSTITQQVVKSFLLSPERSYLRKAKEMILAVRIEHNLTKEEILHLYLNQIYLGRGAYGVESAARTYFGKSAGQLTLAEAAQLAGIVREPGNNPVSQPQKAHWRKVDALDRMLKVGLITPQQKAEAEAEKPQVRPSWPNPNIQVAPYFAEHVRRLLEERYGSESLYNDGWRVFTTVNIEAQEAADQAVARGLWEYGRRRGYRGAARQLADAGEIKEFLAGEAKKLPEEGLEPDHLYRAVIQAVDIQSSALSIQIGPYPGRISSKNLAWALKKGETVNRFKVGEVIWARLTGPAGAQPLEFSLEQRMDTQSALLSMDVRNGDVKALVGGRDFSESQFNRAVQSQRQPGSCFKPILYAAAMDNGFTPGSVLNDAPFVVDDPGSGKRWKPVNSDLKFKGPMSLYTALVGSRNLISIKILDRIGFDALDETARNLGITEKLPASLTLALGAHGLHLPELVTAYSAFANMGPRAEPRYITRIEDRNGQVVATFEPRIIPALDPGTACAVTFMLRGVVEQGTGTMVKPLGRPVAGKTGTTNDFSDAWFIGFTPELVTAVWVGTDQQRPRAVGEVGGRVAGPIFLYYMQEALKDRPVTDFVVPPEAVLTPGGACGICYKAGTVGTGISEAFSPANPEDEFLRDDFEGASEPARETITPPPTAEPARPPAPAAIAPRPAQPRPAPVAAPAPIPAPQPAEPTPPPSRRPTDRLPPYGQENAAPGRLPAYGE